MGIHDMVSNPGIYFEQSDTQAHSGLGPKTQNPFGAGGPKPISSWESEIHFE
jgi:hypothetical protein